MNFDDYETKYQPIYNECADVMKYITPGIKGTIE